MGAAGEAWVVRFLEKQGWQILDQNVRFKSAEIDIIAFDPKWQELVFVEVKTRQSLKFGSPSQAVNHQKIAAMQRVAGAYIKRYNYHYDYRFDIVTVIMQRGKSPQVEHFENITWL